MHYSGGPSQTPQFVSWDDKWGMAHLLMYDITRGSSYLSKVWRFSNLGSPTRVCFN